MDSFFTITQKIISGISFIFRYEIVKTKRTHALLFKSRHFHSLYSHRPQPKPISARDSDSYCKNGRLSPFILLLVFIAEI